VVLSLNNEGQSLGFNGSGNILPEVQNSLSEVDPVIQSGEHIIPYLLPKIEELRVEVHVLK
jgi:hypothetical protein